MILSRTHILKFFSNVKFIIIVLFRSFLILFKRNKSVQLIQLDYNTKYIFDNSLFAIIYKFKNALWYEFKDIKSTTSDSIVLLNRNIANNPIKFIVHGLFNKQEFLIDLSPDTTLNSDSFLTSLSNLSSLKYNSYNLKLNLSLPALLIKDISFNIKPEIVYKPIKISQSDFKESDYL